jgi:hypothetical protein
MKWDGIRDAHQMAWKCASLFKGTQGMAKKTKEKNQDGGYLSRWRLHCSAINEYQANFWVVIYVLMRYWSEIFFCFLDHPKLELSYKFLVERSQEHFFTFRMYEIYKGKYWSKNFEFFFCLKHVFSPIKSHKTWKKAIIFFPSVTRRRAGRRRGQFFLHAYSLYHKT